MTTTKFWRIMMMLLVVATLSVSLTSCGDDDDKDDPNDTASLLLGSWNEIGDDDCLQFNADGTGLLFFIPAYPEDNEFFRYKLSNTTLQIFWADGETNVCRVSFPTSSTMILTYESGYEETYVRLN